MTDNIRDIFEQNIVLLGQTDKAICYFRRQQHDIALGIIADAMDLIKHSIEAIINDREYFNLVSTDSVMEMLSGILDSYKKVDYILLADLLELQLVNFIIGVQELIIGKEEISFDEERYYENIEFLKDNSSGLEKLLNQPVDPQELLMKGYRVEFTSCGLMTLVAQNGDASFYFHTNNRIYAEAFMLAGHWYRKDLKEYIIYGLGFGYHIHELLNISDQAKITIYESDLNVIKLASIFTRLKELMKSGGRLKLVYDPEYQELKQRIKNITQEEEFFVHYPSFQNIRNDEGRRLMKNHVSWNAHEK